jgi:predicted nuclease of restriction endonuclease-like (RecB) superfamily
MIEQARQNALKSVNAELIQLYWNVGEYLSKESAKASWGDAFIDATANYIKENCPEIRGFTRRGLYRMRQFYETYKGNEFVSPLVTQISWTNHLLILSGAKTIEEKEFYIALCAKGKYSKRELERQMESGYYHRYMLSAKSQPPALATHDDDTRFLDRYVLEFLDLPETFSESDLKHAIVQNLKNFVLEIGKDFSFIGFEEVDGHAYIGIDYEMQCAERRSIYGKIQGDDLTDSERVRFFHYTTQDKLSSRFSTLGKTTRSFFRCGRTRRRLSEGI